MDCKSCAQYSYGEPHCLIDSEPDKDIGICIYYQRRPTAAIRYPCRYCLRREPGCHGSCSAYAAALAEAARRRHEDDERLRTMAYLSNAVKKRKRKR